MGACDLWDERPSVAASPGKLHSTRSGEILSQVVSAEAIDASRLGVSHMCQWDVVVVVGGGGVIRGAEI